MRNPTTGEMVTCSTPYSRIKLGEAQQQIAAHCMQACERRGFAYVGNYVAPLEHYQGMPPTRDEDAKPFIPSRCLPEDSSIQN
jgi:hypothetical protein